MELEQSVIDEVKAAEKDKDREHTVITLELDSDETVYMMFAAPTPADNSRYFDATKDAKPSNIRTAMQNLVMGCLRYPSAAEALKLFQRKPLAVISIVEELQKLNGGSIKASSKKV